MLKLLITPPFTQPIAPHYLDHDTELQPILDEYGIKIVKDPAEADLELCGYQAGRKPGAHSLPKDRVVVIDGEPPQPEYFLPYYSESGFAGILCPANSAVYAPDCMAFYTPPDRQLAKRPMKKRKVVQLTTYRSEWGNDADGEMLTFMLNGEQEYSFRVLCVPRCYVGLAMKQQRPEMIDIFGMNWPKETGVVQAGSRRHESWYEMKNRVLMHYGFDLCWENMEIPCLATEKIWQPIRLGLIPIYWGAPEMHGLLPPDTIIDCRTFFGPSGFNIDELIRVIEDMTEAEYARRVKTLTDWYLSLPEDSDKQSLLAAAHIMAKNLLQIAERTL